MRKPQYRWPWPKVRLQILERDNWTCQMCGARATTVDHITPLADHGSRLDPNNLRAACVKCNSGRGRRPHPNDLTPSRQW